MGAGCDDFGDGRRFRSRVALAFPPFCQTTLVAGSRPTLNGDSSYVVGGVGCPPGRHMTSRLAGGRKNLKSPEKGPLASPAPPPSPVWGRGVTFSVMADSEVGRCWRFRRFALSHRWSDGSQPAWVGRRRCLRLARQCWLRGVGYSSRSVGALVARAGGRHVTCRLVGGRGYRAGLLRRRNISAPGSTSNGCGRL